jgi:SNF2 family DNA or RNA helicase
LSEDEKRIEVFFRYSPAAVEAIKTVPGYKFVPKEKGGPHWTIPKDMLSARALRDAFGEPLELGAAVEAWGREARANSRNLQRLAKSDDADLVELPQVLPELAEFLRPFQRADVAFMAKTSVMNANEQGLGKTVETIAAVFEARLDEGPQLVVAPLTSLRTVWKYELDRWTGDPVLVLDGSLKAYEIALLRDRARKLIKKGEPFWLLTTAAQIRKGLDPPLKGIKWKTLIVDEFHKTGLTNVSGDPSKGTAFGRAVRGIKRERSFFLSGTPMGGKPVKLWGCLNHLKPDVFTSKWRWAEQWLVIDNNGYGKSIKGIRPEKVDEFYPFHAEYIVRRLKREVLPQLPDKQYIDVWCDMPGKQKQQYDAMEKYAELRIEEERLSAMGVLAEYTRLKQFASAERSIDVREIKRRDGTTDQEITLPCVASCKLEPLVERLDEAGIRASDPEGDSVSVVASQSKVFINWIAEQLNAKGIRTELITGDTPAEERFDIVKRFQSGDDSPRVIAVTTTAGGVAITLDRADTIHILDETWNPDDQVQLEDRIHRISRIHQVMVYKYRTKGTIEEQIAELNMEKAITTKNIMDVRRMMFKEGK